MKKKLVAVFLLVFSLFLVGCGGKGGLTNYFGLKEKDITSISYWYGGRSVTLDSSKYGDFMDTFNVEFVGTSSAGSKSNGQYTIKYDGSANPIALYIQPDGKVVASQFDGVVTIYYISVEAIEIPYSLKS